MGGSARAGGRLGDQLAFLPKRRLKNRTTARQKAHTPRRNPCTGLATACGAGLAGAAGRSATTSDAPDSPLDREPGGGVGGDAAGTFAAEMLASRHWANSRVIRCEMSSIM